MTKKLLIAWLIIFGLSVSFGLGWLTRYIQTKDPLSHDDLLMTPLNSDPLNPSVLLSDVNSYRTDHQLTPLAESSILCDLSQVRSQQVVTDWSHNGVKLLWKAQPYVSIPYGGENLARDYSTNQDILSAWIASPEHKVNLDNPHYTQACVAINGSYVVMEYGGQ